jgi:coniferyl-aldehyde dehydrogenase
MTASLPLDLQAIFALQRQAFAAQSFAPLAVRLDRLDRLRRLVEEHEQPMTEAISADFGNRSRHETVIGEVIIVLAALAHTRSHLRRWMRKRRVRTSFHSLPGSSWILPQPLGVAGIVSPWNYPLQLALVPAIAALAAGNRVMIKPSELTPRFSQLLS